LRAGAVRGRCSFRVEPQQRVAAGARVAGFADQQVQRQAGQVVGQRLDVEVVLLVEDLAIGMAVVAGFGARYLAWIVGLVDRLLGSSCSMLW
jgi:hypothetical protein